MSQPTRQFIPFHPALTLGWRVLASLTLVGDCNGDESDDIAIGMPEGIDRGGWFVFAVARLA